MWEAAPLTATSRTTATKSTRYPEKDTSEKGARNGTGARDAIPPSLLNRLLSTSVAGQIYLC